VNYISNQLTHAILGALQKQAKLDPNMLPSQTIVKSKLFMVLSALIENPSFDSQTKDTLTTKANDFGSKFELPSSFLKTFTQESGVVEELIEDIQKKV
jgi:DNA topoisomerase-2